MYAELVYSENGRTIAKASVQFNEHNNNGNLPALFQELELKIKAKKMETWNWKKELRKAFYDSFPYVPRKEED